MTELSGRRHALPAPPVGGFLTLAGKAFSSALSRENSRAIRTHQSVRERNVFAILFKWIKQEIS
jgi:hypothetical protein